MESDPIETFIAEKNTLYKKWIINSRLFGGLRVNRNIVEHAHTHHFGIQQPRLPSGIG